MLDLLYYFIRRQSIRIKESWIYILTLSLDFQNIGIKESWIHFTTLLDAQQPHKGAASLDFWNVGIKEYWIYFITSLDIRIFELKNLGFTLLLY